MAYRCVSMWFAAAVAGLLICGCPDDSGDAGGDGETSGDSGESTAPSSMTSPSTTGPGCIPGMLGCVCQEGQCGGSLFCVNDECVEGPQFDPEDEPLDVLAGLRVPYEVEFMGDDFWWEQVDGPAVMLTATDSLNFQVDIPPDTPDGAEITLRLNGVRNTIEGFEDYHINILPASFNDLYANAEEGIELPAEVGTSVALAWGQGSLWVASSEGNITRINGDGLGLQDDIAVGGVPASISLGQVGNGDNSTEVAFIGNAGLLAVQRLNVFGGDLSVFTDTVSGGGAVGEVGHVRFDGNGNDVFFTNGVGGQLLQYFDNDGQTYVLTDTLGTEPSAIEIGPEANTVFVATLGEVWRVPILLTDEDPQTPFAGDPELYVDVGGAGDPLNVISGLRFDDGANLWIAMPGINTLHVARYAGPGNSTTVIRSFDNAPAGLNTFNGLSFNGETIWWANGADRTIAGLRVGLGGL